MTVTKYDRFFLGILFLGGILHWLVFCFLVTPGDYLDLHSMRDSQFIGMLNDPISWFNYREFTVNDWVKDIKYLKIFKEALHSGQVPFHVPGYFDQLGEGIERFRFLAWSLHTIEASKVPHMPSAQLSTAASIPAMSIIRMCSSRSHSIEWIE